MVWIEQNVGIRYLINLIFITGVETLEEWNTNEYVGFKYEGKWLWNWSD